MYLLYFLFCLVNGLEFFFFFSIFWHISSFLFQLKILKCLLMIWFKYKTTFLLFNSLRNFIRSFNYEKRRFMLLMKKITKNHKILVSLTISAVLKKSKIFHLVQVSLKWVFWQFVKLISGTKVRTRRGSYYIYNLFLDTTSFHLEQTGSFRTNFHFGSSVKFNLLEQIASHCGDPYMALSF